MKLISLLNLTFMVRSKKKYMEPEIEKLAKPQLVLLDVYDTMLRMDEIERKMNSLLNNRLGYIVWFELFMQYCFVDNCIVQFNHFPSIAAATMRMAAGVFRRDISDENVEQVLDLLTQLPVHEGVQDGLSALHGLGFRLAPLTNSPEQTVTERMHRTGLISYFEKVLSAEHVGKYKPSLEVYNWAAETLGVDHAHILLVSTHGWDLAGARNAGMQTAYIRQPKQMLYPLAPKPDFIADNLEGLAAQLAHI